MNAYASVFVPSTTMHADPAEERTSQIHFIKKQIEHTKQELAIKNGKLVKLHNQLSIQHAQLIDEMQRRENGEFPCCTQQQIDELTNDYKQRSDFYYSKYTKFNDKTSELVTLQQKLHRLLVAPVPPSSTTDNHNTQRTQRQQLANKRSVTTATEREGSQSNHHNNIRSALDRLEMNYSYSPTPTTPRSVLPPIVESDAENCRMECDENTPQNTNEKCIATGNKAYSDCNKENIDSSLLKHKHKAVATKSDAPRTELSSLTLSNNQKEQPETKEELAKEAAKAPPHLRRYDQHNPLEAQIYSILENMIYSDMETVCSQLLQFVHVGCGTHQTVELLVDLIINYSIQNKPEFFGSKYSFLFQSLVAQFDTHSQRKTTHANIERNHVPRVSLRQLIWKSCLNVFTTLLFGSDGEKFINVMIIIAELLNAELISPQQVFNDVFKLILSDNTNLCENDIEGLYEFFKRCRRVLITSQNKSQLDKYFHIMDKIKNLDKFKSGMHRVPFMVNQMKRFANYSSQPGTAGKRKY